MVENMRKFIKKRLFKIILLTVLIFGIVNHYNFQSVDSSLKIHFIDVGQGNGILIEEDGHYMIIDGGDRQYSSKMVSYLKKKKVKELEYILVSHYDSDHLNGIVGAMNVFSYKNVIAPEYEGDSRVYRSYIGKIKEDKVEVIYPEVGDTYQLGESEFTIISPVGTEYSDVNDYSVGIRLVHGENSFIIGGDAGHISEREMVEADLYLESDVYLANHHGSNGSSLQVFIDEIKPRYVVFSCGKDNSYGHPGEKAMERIKNWSPKIYRTDMQGDIIVTSDGKSLEWNVEPWNEKN